MLTISGLTYRIGGHTMLNGASVQIPARSRVGLVGRNGAGKSTLLALSRGPAQPDAGSIRLPRGDRIGFLPPGAPGGAGDAPATGLPADQQPTLPLAAPVP